MTVHCEWNDWGLVNALKHVEVALGPTPAHKRFPPHMGVMNVTDLLLWMKAAMFKNVQVIDIYFGISSSLENKDVYFTLVFL